MMMMQAGLTSLVLILSIFSSAAFIPSKRTSEPVSLRRCMITIESQCVRPVVQQYQGMSLSAVAEKIRTTDLRETCAPILQAQECVGEVLESAVCDVEMPDFLETVLEMYDVTITYVCRNHVDVFNEHKGCLLTGDEDGLTVVRAVIQECSPQALPEPGRCPPPSVLDCAQSVVTRECGAELAGHIRALDEQLLEVMGCSSKRFKMMKKDQYELYNPFKTIHKSISSLF